MLRVALALVVFAAAEPRVTTLDLDDDLLSRGRLGGVSVDDDGFIYVSDFGSTIWRISPEGGVEVLDNSLRGSLGNAIDSAGNLYQASVRDNRIVRIDKTGKIARPPLPARHRSRTRGRCLLGRRSRWRHQPR